MHACLIRVACINKVATKTGFTVFHTYSAIRWVFFSFLNNRKYFKSVSCNIIVFLFKNQKYLDLSYKTALDFWHW